MSCTALVVRPISDLQLLRGWQQSGFRCGCNCGTANRHALPSPSGKSVPSRHMPQPLAFCSQRPCISSTHTWWRSVGSLSFTDSFLPLSSYSQLSAYRVHPNYSNKFLGVQPPKAGLSASFGPTSAILRSYRGIATTVLSTVVGVSEKKRQNYSQHSNPASTHQEYLGDHQADKSQLEVSWCSTCTRGTEPWRLPF